jgi:hypothetical protein
MVYLVSLIRALFSPGDVHLSSYGLETRQWS